MARVSSGLQYPERFYTAASFAGFGDSPRASSKALRSRFSSEAALILFALHQQATHGPCRVPEPSASNAIERSKWTSWKQLGEMAPTEAMRLFVKLIEEEEPGWYSRASNFVAEPVVDIQMNNNLKTEPAVENGSSDPEPKTVLIENGVSEPVEKEAEVKDVISEGLSSIEVYDQWTSPPISSQRPKPRYEHGAAVVQDKMYIYGGNHNGRYLNDLHVDSMPIDDKDNCIGDNSIENVTPPDSPDVYNAFGEPVLTPRIGEIYQVDIPPLISESERKELFANPFDSEAPYHSHAFLVGLPVQFTWVHDGSDDPLDPNVSLEPRKVKKGHTSSSRKRSSEHGLEQISNSENSEPVLAVEMNLEVPKRSQSYCAVPGVATKPWSDADVDSFILGLYIFGKNFSQIKRFMGNKEMGMVISFYYGKFHGSEAYRRWSGSRRKVRRKKCVTGRKIFTGWRQQEFLSRLSTHVSEETQKSLLEVYKSFAEGKILFEAYVTSLKSILGNPLLVEVVAIGKGKDDLTGISTDPGRTNHDILVCPHLPSGQACSSLSSKEIVNLLTGGFRLSKGRCSDIFWEAVWPRLLAKGWHSEQPKNQGYVSSKNYLVFLTPGVKKFSRRKLLKGEHYFDSVSDVLNRVASEPKLIELDSEEASGGGQNGQAAWSPETGSDPDDMAGSQRRCYLKPRISANSSSQMKFTVVDTSLVFGGRSSSVRELRHLPAEFNLSTKITNYLIDDDGDSSDNVDDFEIVEKPLQREKVKYEKGVSGSGGSHCIKFTVVDTSLVHGGKPVNVRELTCSPLVAKNASDLATLLRKTATGKDSLAICDNDPSDISTKSKRKISKSNSNKNEIVCATTNQIEADPTAEKHSERTVLHQFKRRANPGQTDYVVPVVKRRRLTACAKAKLPELPSQNCSQSCSKQDESREKTPVSDIGPKPESSTSLRIEKGPDGDIKLKIRTHKFEVRNGEASSMVDLPTGDRCSPSKEKEKEKEKDLVSERLTLTSSIEVGTFDQNPVANRRQSTRNRPLTTRALEALANGFLNVQRRPKNKISLAEENPFSNPCRKARTSKAKAASSLGIVGPKDDREVNGGHFDVKKSTISQPLDRAEEKRNTDQ